MHTQEKDHVKKNFVILERISYHIFQLEAKQKTFHPTKIFKWSCTQKYIFKLLAGLPATHEMKRKSKDGKRKK